MFNDSKTIMNRKKQEVKISIYSTIDSTNLSLVDQYLSENFQIVDVENEWPNKIFLEEKN